MTVIAAGARYDRASGDVQAYIVITDDDGFGHPIHLNPHKLHAAERGEGWINVDSDILATFKNHSEIFEHISNKIALARAAS